MMKKNTYKNRWETRYNKELVQLLSMYCGILYSLDGMCVMNQHVQLVDQHNKLNLNYISLTVYICKHIYMGVTTIPGERPSTQKAAQCAAGSPS